MGLDAMALGNHEFDKSIVRLRREMKMAKFPFLSANITLKEDGSFLEKPLIKKEAGDLNVYIIGFTTCDLPNIILPSRLKKLNIQDPIEAGKKYIEKFEENSLIIALSHTGLYPHRLTPSGKLTSIKKVDKNLEPDDIDIAMGLPQIDVIIGGHSHTILRAPLHVGNTLIAQAGSNGEYLGRLDLIIDRGNILEYTYRLIPINEKIIEKRNGRTGYVFLEKEIPEDIKILNLVKPLLKKVEFSLIRVIGSNKRYLSKRDHYIREIPLGNLITDAMAKKGHCEISIQAAGGIRSDLPNGPVMIKHVYAIHPFGNTIVRTTLSGRKLLSVLQEGYAAYPKRYFLQVSGMKIKVNIKNKKVSILKIRGTPFDPDRNYILCSDSFLASGGDTMKILASLKSRYDTGSMVHDGLIDYIKEKKIIDYGIKHRIILEK